jgi:hypothetical protein
MGSVCSTDDGLGSSRVEEAQLRDLQVRVTRDRQEDYYIKLHCCRSHTNDVVPPSNVGAFANSPFTDLSPHYVPPVELDCDVISV